MVNLVHKELLDQEVQLVSGVSLVLQVLLEKMVYLVLQVYLDLEELLALEEDPEDQWEHLVKWVQEMEHQGSQVCLDNKVNQGFKDHLVLLVHLVQEETQECQEQEGNLGHKDLMDNQVKGVDLLTELDQ